MTHTNGVKQSFSRHFETSLLPNARAPLQTKEQTNQRNHLLYDPHRQILAASPPYRLLVIQNITFPTAVDATASRNHHSSSVKPPSLRNPSSSSIICRSICSCNAHTTALASSVPCRHVTVLTTWTRLIMSLVSPSFSAQSSLS